MLSMFVGWIIPCINKSNKTSFDQVDTINGHYTLDSNSDILGRNIWKLMFLQTPTNRMPSVLLDGYNHCFNGQPLGHTGPLASVVGNSQATRDVGLQCVLVDIDKLVTNSKESHEHIENELLNDYQSKVTEAKNIYHNVLAQYKEQLESQQVLFTEREEQWVYEMRSLKEKLSEQEELMQQLKSSSDKNLKESAGGNSSTTLTLEQFKSLLEKWQNSSDVSPHLLATQQTIEEGMLKWYELLQQQAASADVASIRNANDALEKQNKALYEQVRLQESTAQDLRYSLKECQLIITDLQEKRDELRTKVS